MCRTANLVLPGVPESPRRARTFLLERLREWGWRPVGSDAGLADQGQLVLSELVTNALRHANGRMEVQIEAHHDRLTLSVTDPLPSAGPLTPQQVEPASQNGRGLAIVDSLTSSWGVREEPAGKTVWAQLPVPASSWLAGLCGQHRTEH